MSNDWNTAAWMGPLPTLTLWKDPVARTGWECMAADELMLGLPGSWMRIYRWGRPTVSFGCFDTSAEASRLFPDAGIDYIRRWTGGGIVDHRTDIPFTLALSPEDRPCRPTSAVLYKWIHGALAAAMKQCGVACRLLPADAPDGGRACFSSPVASDLVGPNGEKLAGGGQRRTPLGILHQGSIQNCILPEGWDLAFAELLSIRFTIIETEEPAPGFRNAVRTLAEQKYASAAWNDETHGRRGTHLSH